MAVYTPLSDQALREYLRPFRLGEVVRFQGVSAGTINTIYEVVTKRGRYILRILENRTLTDARFEEALLQHLLVRRMRVPSMVKADGHGRILSIGPKQQLSVFEYLPGREIGVFEVQPEHARQAGQFLARLHSATADFVKRRQNRFDPPRMLRLWQRCEQTCTGPDEALADLQRLQQELLRHHWSADLPRGVVHGDLFIDNVRFSKGRLVGVLDFEMASTGALIYDLAVAMCDWAFQHDNFLVGHAKALITGYESVRCLADEERSSLYDFCRFAAARFALTRFYDFEVRKRPEAQRLYKDYRHFLARLQALQSLGPATFTREFWPNGAAGKIEGR